MKIACISASQVPSATANSIQALKACQALAQCGHDIVLLVPQGPVDSTPPPTPAPQGAGEKDGGDLAGEARQITTISPAWKSGLPSAIREHYGLETEFPIEWIPADPRLRRYDFALRAVRRARALHVDLVYAWPVQAAVMASAARLPVMLEMHGPPEGKLGPQLFRLFLRLGGRKCLLSITQALADMLRRDYALPDHLPVVIAPNGVELSRYQNLPEPAAARLALGLPERPTAGYTGHLYPGRGTGLLLGLARRFPQVHFLWVGGQPADMETWRARLEAEGIANVTLTGFVENSRLPLYQAAAEVLLMPYERSIAGSSGGNSAAYASPMKMFEYMACGRAILSSDLPVIGEVLNPANAVLCPPEDLEAWSRALAELLDDPQRCAALGQQAAADVQAYTWQRRAAKALAALPLPAAKV